jgi:glycosyltransferase involved in cell wall biosynthesis
VIHNGLPGEVVATARLRTPGAKLRLGYAGRLVQPKGIHELLRVMQAMDPSQCELLVAGKGSAQVERELKQLAPAHVAFLGFIDPDELLRNIDVLVVPSVWQDPLPTIAIEALRRGVPAIVSDRGGLPDIVLDGQTGRVYQADDPGGLRRALQEFIGQPERAGALAAAVLDRAGYFGAERMTREYEEVLAGAAAGAAARERGGTRRATGVQAGFRSP